MSAAYLYGEITIICGVALVLVSVLLFLCRGDAPNYVDVTYEPRVNGGGLDERG